MRDLSFILGLFLPAHAALAHGGGTFDELMALMWGSPIALLLLALALAALSFAAHYAFYHERRLALRTAALVAVLTGVPLFYLSGMFSAPEPIAPGEGALVGAVATVYKSPTCGCCSGYIEELKRQGASVDVRVVGDAELAKFKAEQGIAPEHYSCHTSIIDGYVVEGHVPIEAVAKLRTERPATPGIALPGMPSGTPGMPGPKLETYDIRTLDGGEFMRI